MSVNRTVASMRSLSARRRSGQKFLDRGNDLLVNKKDGRSRAVRAVALPGICSARKRPHSTLTSVASVQWIAGVGTWIEDRISLTSIWLSIRTTAVAAAGLALSRSNQPHNCCKARSFLRDGANAGRLWPLPQDFSIYL